MDDKDARMHMHTATCSRTHEHTPTRAHNTDATSDDIAQGWASLCSSASGEAFFFVSVGAEPSAMIWVSLS